MAGIVKIKMSEPQDLNLICRGNDIANNYQAIASFIRIPIQFGLLCFIIYRIRRLFLQHISRSIIFIHLWMLLWALFFSTADALKLAQYETIKNMSQISEYPKWALNIVPRIFIYFDISTGFIISTLLMLCPYYWIQNILYFLSGISSFEDHKWVIRINKCIYVYIMATRIIMFLSFLSVLFINSNKLNTAIDIFIGFVGAESVLVIVWVLYGQRFLIKNFERISLADCSQNQRMRTQSIILVLISMIRLFCNVVLTILISLQMLKLRDWMKELCVQSGDSIRQYVIFYNSVICVIHYLPIIVLLWLYKPPQQVDSSSESMGSSFLG